jgi:hypothetical protein
LNGGSYGKKGFNGLKIHFLLKRAPKTAGGIRDRASFQAPQLLSKSWDESGREIDSCPFSKMNGANGNLRPQRGQKLNQ